MLELTNGRRGGSTTLADQLTETVADMSVNARALVGRVSAGDRSAIESLCHSYYPRRASFLWRSIGRRESVEEIITDTFLEVWSDAKTFGDASLVSTRIVGIAYRRALEVLRQ